MTDTALRSGQVRITLVFGAELGAPVKYGAILSPPMHDKETASDHIASVVERTARRHYGLDPVLFQEDA